MELEIQRHLRRNFIANMGDGTLWLFGFSFLSSATILPVYFAHLSSSTLLLGLIPALLDLGWFLPQLFIAPRVERLARKKPWVLVLGIGERLPFLLLAAGALWLAQLPSTQAVAFFFVLIAIRALASGLVATPWQEMIAKVIPMQWRGRFFGFSHSVGGGLGLIGSVIATLILARYPYPTNFAICFFVGFMILMVSWTSLLWIRESAQPPAPSAPTAYRKRLASILREDHNFRTYLFSRGLGYLGAMSFGFFAVYGVGRFQLGDAQAAVFTAVMSAVGMLSNLIWGPLGDRLGHKLVMEWSTALWAGALILALVAPSGEIYYGVFALVGAANAGYVLSDLSIAMEFGPEAQRPTYIGLARTLSAPLLFVAPLVGGAVAQLGGYPWMFALALALTLASLVMLRSRVIEPRKALSEER